MASAMSILKQSSVHNKLVGILPAEDFSLISPDLEYIALPRTTPLAAAGKPIDYVYFLTSGIGSVVVTTPHGNQAEAGIFGFDGYVPTSVVTGTELSTYDVHMQLAGDGYRMAYQVFGQHLESNRNFFKVMIRSMEGFSVQLAYTAVSNAVHDVNERLARWLLMCHDRVSGNEIHLTHEFISLMLTVRRPSVTTSLQILEGNGFIWSKRGVIIIRDRAALEEFASDAYGKPEEEYRRLMKDLF
jgi:CRP-like cAMP-binding protein